MSVACAEEVVAEAGVLYVGFGPQDRSHAFRRTHAHENTIAKGACRARSFSLFLLNLAVQLDVTGPAYIYAQQPTLNHLILLLYELIIRHGLHQPNRLVNFPI